MLKGVGALLPLQACMGMADIGCVPFCILTPGPPQATVFCIAIQGILRVGIEDGRGKLMTLCCLGLAEMLRCSLGDGEGVLPLVRSAEGWASGEGRALQLGFPVALEQIGGHPFVVLVAHQETWISSHV